MANFKEAHNVFLSCDADWKQCGMYSRNFQKDYRHDHYSANFNEAQELVKKAEGGYSDDPRDPGNYTGGKIGVGDLIGTKYGISAPVLVAELKRLGGKPPTKSTMQNLEYASAEAIYKRNYWNPIKGDEIKDQKLANMIYDTAVNMGVGRAQKYVRDSVGLYDATTINRANADKLFNEIGKKREEYYNKRGGYALNSWLDRLAKLGYGGLDAIKKNQKTTIAVILGIGALATAFYLYNKNK